MAAAKLFRSSLAPMSLSWKSQRQTPMILNKSFRNIASAVSIHFNECNSMKPFMPICTQRVMSTSAKFEVINVQDEEDFKKRVICASDCTPVIVDFHATWCGPCKLLAPRLESIISKKNGKVMLAKVDIDDNPDLAMEYGVRSVPMVMGVSNGKTVNQFIGVIDDDQIDSFVEKLMIS